jgi:hypothetical protein
LMCGRYTWQVHAFLSPGLLQYRADDGLPASR